MELRRLYEFLSFYIRMHPKYPGMGVMTGLHFRTEPLQRTDSGSVNVPWFFSEPEEKFLLYRHITEAGPGIEAWLVMDETGRVYMLKRRHTSRGYYDMFGMVKSVTLDLGG